MACGRTISPDIGSVTLRAGETRVFLFLLNLCFKGRDGSIGRSLMTRGARTDRNVRLEFSQRRCPGDIYVAGRAFRRVLFARVRKLDRDTLEPTSGDRLMRRFGKLVASGAVVLRRLLIFPVTVKAGSMCCGDGLKTVRHGDKPVVPSSRRGFGCFRVGLVADRTVVVSLSWDISRLG